MIDLTDLLLDDTTAVVTPRQFADLGEYSCSLPTGQTIGKRWKRDESFNRPGPSGVGPWLLGEYAECDPPDPKRIRIIWRDLLVVQP